MPIYEYRATLDKTACAHCGCGFDVLQKLSEPVLEVCPECGETVHRIISAPNLQNSGMGKDVLNHDHIAKHGFTQYKKAGGGVYEKTAGDGPRFISGKDKKPI